MAQRRDVRHGAGKGRNATTRGRARAGSGSPAANDGRVPPARRRGEAASTGPPGAESAGSARTTRAAKWIDALDVHEDRAGQPLATRDHDVIRRWAEARGAAPARLVDGRAGDPARILRFDFPGFSGASLRKIDWEDWFGTFDQRQLVFLYQEHKKDGAQSTFFRLDNPRRSDG